MSKEFDQIKDVFARFDEVQPFLWLLASELFENLDSTSVFGYFISEIGCVITMQFDLLFE